MTSRTLVIVVAVLAVASLAGLAFRLTSGLSAPDTLPNVPQLTEDLIVKVEIESPESRVELVAWGAAVGAGAGPIRLSFSRSRS